MASVSPDLVKVWSLASGECIHELSSNGSQFHSCVFHPSYSTLLVIGGIRVSFSVFFTLNVLFLGSMTNNLHYFIGKKYGRNRVHKFFNMKLFYEHKLSLIML